LAGRAALPPIAATFRAAAVDVYYQSIRLVPANLVWGAAFLAWLWLAVAGPAAVAFVAAPLLCLPLVGVFRLAAQQARGEDVVLSDAAGAVRRFGLRSLALGAVLTGIVVVSLSNVALGVALGGPAGWSLATLAAWGLVAAWVAAIVAWPLLVDPAREDLTIRARLELAGLVILASPGRFLAFAAALAVVAALSTVAIVAIMSISLAFIAAAASRFVLPAADALERQLGTRDEREPASGSTTIATGAEAVIAADRSGD
jgi:hypothetical protein